MLRRRRRLRRERIAHIDPRTGGAGLRDRGDGRKRKRCLARRGRACNLGDASAWNAAAQDSIDLRNAGRKQLRGLFDLQRQGGGHSFCECGFDLKADCGGGGHRSIFALCSPIRAGSLSTGI